MGNSYYHVIIVSQQTSKLWSQVLSTTYKNCIIQSWIIHSLWKHQVSTHHKKLKILILNKTNVKLQDRIAHSFSTKIATNNKVGEIYLLVYMYKCTDIDFIWQQVSNAYSFNSLYAVAVLCVSLYDKKYQLRQCPFQRVPDSCEISMFIFLQNNTKQ